MSTKRRRVEKENYSANPRTTRGSHSDSLLKEIGATSAPSLLYKPSTDLFAVTDELSLSGMPLNNDGFTYTLAIAEPLAESKEDADRRIMHPVSLPLLNHLSPTDRNASVTLNRDGTVCHVAKGYRSVRANYCARTPGYHYYEVDVLSCNTTPSMEGPNVRVGWMRRGGSLQGPVGADAFGYALRSVGGEKVHAGQVTSYGRPIVKGDTIGVELYLPSTESEAMVDTSDNNNKKLKPLRSRLPIRWKGQCYFEQKDVTHGAHSAWLKQEEARAQACAAGSLLTDAYMTFYLNGEPLEEILAKHMAWCPDRMGPSQDGYFPAISCYQSGAVQYNPGPHFKFPPARHTPIAKASDDAFLRDLVWHVMEKMEGTITVQDAAKMMRE